MAAEGNVNLEFTADPQRAQRAIALLSSENDKLREKLKLTGKAAKDAGKDMETGFGGASTTLRDYAAGLVSVGAAIGLARQGYQGWLREIRDVSLATRNAMADITAFAALQSGGTMARRVQEVNALIGAEGIRDRGTAFELVQGLQSNFKDAQGMDEETAFQRSKAASREVFRGVALGVQLPSAAAAAKMAINMGLDPTQFLRQAYVAGEVSTATPEDIIAAAAGTQTFSDKAFALAAAGALQPITQDMTEVHLRQLGMALSDVSDANKRKGGRRSAFERLGLAKTATQEERLAAMAAAGIDTPVEIEGMGITEERQRKAVQIAVQNQKAITAYKARILADSGPGLFELRRSSAEQELPGMRVAREIGSIEAMQAEAKAFGPRALGMTEEDREQAARALAIRRAGRTRAFGIFDTIEQTPTGERSGPFDQFLMYAQDVVNPFQGPTNSAAEVERSTREILDAQRRHSEALERNTAAVQKHSDLLEKNSRTTDDNTRATSRMAAPAEGAERLAN